MRLLLDTHIAIWSVTGDPLLPPEAERLLLAPTTTAFVSIASIWEIAIKSALARGRPGDVPLNGYEAIDAFEDASFVKLPIEPDHVAAVGALALIHGDPFDRLLVAQARAEGLRLLTHDSRLSLYGDFIILV